MRAGLWQAAAVTLAGHGAVLSLLGAMNPPVVPQGVSRPPVFTVAVRATIPVPTEATRIAVVEAPAAPPATPSEPVKAESVPVPSPPAVPVPPPPSALPGTEQNAAVVEMPYLPRGQLTVAPRMLSFVQVPFPDDVTGMVNLKVKLTLFIDESGSVQRIRLDTPDVHSAFERTIRESFGSARFTPGELDKVPVRSQIRLEVEFQAPNNTRG